jgi:hypothetical protein
VKRHFYLLSVLPGLKTFESPPPVSKQELLSVVTESGGPTEIVQLLFLNDDLLQREAVLAGEIDQDQMDPAVLSHEQSTGKEPLPDFLVTGHELENESVDNRIVGDSIQRNYFHHVSEIAKIYRSPFLKAWVQFEVGLRNALTKVRAEALKLDPNPYLVAPELENPNLSFENILGDWMRVHNPLEAVEVLDRARWNQVTEHEQWFSFGNDEIAAYATKLMILHRWRRIIGKDHI